MRIVCEPVMPERHVIEPLILEREAAAILRMHPKTLAILRKAGEVPHRMVSGRAMYSTSDLEQIIEQAKRP